MPIDPGALSKETLVIVVWLLLAAGAGLVAALGWLAKQLVNCLNGTTDQSRTMSEALRIMNDQLRSMSEKRSSCGEE